MVEIFTYSSHIHCVIEDLAMAHKVIILGASGYTGAELVRLIASHSGMKIIALSADSKAGLRMTG